MVQKKVWWSTLGCEWQWGTRWGVWKKGVIRRAATGLAKVGDTTARRTTRMTVEAVTALRWGVQQRKFQSRVMSMTPFSPSVIDYILITCVMASHCCPRHSHSHLSYNLLPCKINDKIVNVYLPLAANRHISSNIATRSERYGGCCTDLKWACESARDWKVNEKIWG